MCPMTARPESDRMPGADKPHGKTGRQRRASILQSSAAARSLLASAVAALLWIVVAWAMRSA